MNLISRVIIQLLANGAALYASQYFIDGFSVTPSVEAYLKIAAILTVVHLIIRPILRLILSPVIFITLGLGAIVLNAVLLYVVDYFMADLSISGLFPLVYATLIIGIVNYLITVSARKHAQSEK